METVLVNPGSYVSFIQRKLHNAVIVGWRR
jgi:hypothetical protein